MPSGKLLENYARAQVCELENHLKNKTTDAEEVKKTPPFFQTLHYMAQA